jgi:hypothetical protein
MNNEKVQSELQKFKDKKSYDKHYYHTIIKNDPEKLQKKRLQAKEYMSGRKDRSKELYEKNKEVILIKNQIRYYKSRNRLSEYKNKDSYKKALELKLIDPIE